MMIWSYLRPDFIRGPHMVSDRVITSYFSRRFYGIRRIWFSGFSGAYGLGFSKDLAPQFSHLTSTDH